MAARKFPIATSGLWAPTWWACLFALGLSVLLVAERVTRRLLPLSALFKLSLIFPDEAPSRFGIALKSNSTRKLERRIAEVRESGFPSEETQYAETMLELVAGLSLHDRLTRGHSERVRAYTDMIAEEMNLPSEEASKLRWASLLHDVGKIFVPSEILNKPGRPTREEWEILKSHTWKGDELIDPLRDFLGDYSTTVRNHHERWDGDGYPDRLAGKEIPIGARIVAVADAYDVMTSARSYKEPRPAKEARAEIAACAGSQFDPTVARAFLNIGLGRLRFAAGPLSWAANFQAATQIPIAPAMQPVIAAGSAMAATATAVALSLSPATPDLAFPEPAVVTVPITTPATTIPTTTTTIPTTTTTIDPQPDPQPILRRVDEDGEVTIERAIFDAAASDLDSPGEDLTFAILSEPDPGVGTLVVEKDADGQLVSVSFVPAPNVNGSTVVDYGVCDADGNCGRGTVEFTIVAVNDAPIAVGETPPSLNEDESFRFSDAQILSNDSDVENEALEVNWGTLPAGATVSNDDITFFRANFAGTISLPYRVCTPAGMCSDPVSIDLTYLPINDAPTANPDQLSVTEESSTELLSTMVLANDSDAEGDPLTVKWPTQAYLDTNSVPPVFTPPPDFNGVLELSYEACDPSLCSNGKLSVTVTGVNDQPVANDDTLSATEDTPLALEPTLVLGNDTDVEGDTLTVTWSPQAGIDSTTTPTTFTPPQDFNGSTTLQYSACDPGGLCDSGTVTVQVSAVDDLPVAVGETPAPVDEDTDFVVSDAALLANDVDVDGDTLSIQWGAPSVPGGTLDASGGQLQYTPPVDYDGPVTLPYQVCSAPDRCSSPVDLALWFSQVDDLPVANGEVPAAQDEDTPFVTNSFGLLANDSDTEGDPLTLEFGTPSVTGGTLDIATSITYTPPADFVGTVLIPYQACSAPGVCSNVVNIELTFNNVNDDPSIALTPYPAPGVESQPTTVTFADLIANTSDIDNPQSDLSVSITSALPGLTVTATDFTYLPTFGATDSATVTYVVCDLEPACVPGSVELTFTPVDDPPAALDDSRTINEDGSASLSRAEMIALAADIDTAGTDLSFTFTPPPAAVAVLLVNSAPDGSFDSVTAVPPNDYNGQFSFPYEVCDLTSCATGLITIDVTPINDPPVVGVSPYNVQGTESQPVTVTRAELSALATDVDSLDANRTISFVAPTDPRFFQDLTGFTWTPSDDSVAPVTIDYLACDNEVDNQCGPGRVILNFTPVDDPPVANPIPVVLAEDTILYMPNSSFAGFITDPDSPVSDLTITVTTISPADSVGILVLPNSDLVMTPFPDFSGPVTAAYTVCDLTSCVDSSFNIVVTADNDLPELTGPPSPTSTLSSDPVTLPQDFTYDDADGDTAYPVPLAPSSGSVAVLPDDSIVYTPVPGFDGVVTIPFTLCDQDACTPTAVGSWEVTVSNPSLTLFLTNPGSGDTAHSPILALSTTAPVDPTLADYDNDRNSLAGLTIRQSLESLASEVDEDHQDWYFTGSGNDILSGPVTLDLWVADNDFDTSEYLAIDAQLAVCDAGSCTTLGTQRWEAFATTGFAPVTIDFGSISTELTGTEQLRLRLAVPDPVAKSRVVIAYDTTAYPAALNIN